MTDNINNTVSEDSFKRGLQMTINTLKNTKTTVERDGVVVTITAEPLIVDIKIEDNSTPATLPERLKGCLNQAFKESSQKILEQATKELDDSTK